MKDVTILPRLSARMTSDFKNFKKLTVTYIAAKGYKHWLGVIEILEPIPDTEWEMKRPS